MALTEASSITLDLLAPDFVADPYPTLQRLREQAPVYRSASGSWVLTRYQDVLDALADPRLGNSPSPYAVVNARNAGKYVCADVANNILPFMDEPRHTAPRKLVTRAFHEYMKSHAPDSPALANHVLDRHIPSGTFDVLHDFATPLSVSLLCQILGIDEANHATQLKRWSEWFFYLFSIIPSEAVRQQLDCALSEFRDFFRLVIAEKTCQPGTDLISAMLVARDGNDSISDAELLDTCLLLLADGVNADHAISNAMATLLTHPGSLQTLRDNPALLPTAVDELLRFDPPALFIGRMALENLEIGGQTIRKNAGVLLMLASANRDSTVFPDADTLDLARDKNPYLSFGKGQHTCIGRPLVRLTLQSALSALLTRLDDISLAEPMLEWAPRLGHRWLARLPVTFIARM